MLFSSFLSLFYPFSRYSGLRGVAENSAFAINGVITPAPIASGIPLIAAIPAYVLNSKEESTPYASAVAPV